MSRPPRGSLHRHRLPRSSLMSVTIIVVALAVLAGGPILAVVLTKTDGNLLSQSKPVAVSSSVGRDFPATAAVDGNPGTTWRSAPRDPQWLWVDLQQRAQISQVVLNWDRRGYAAEYQIQISDDARNWATLYATTGTPSTQTLRISTAGRYVRFYGTARSNPDGYSLREFQVYGSPLSSNCGPTSVARGQPVTASSAESGKVPAAAAVDGDPHTRWASAWSDPQWLQVDLGKRTSVCEVILNWENAYATAYDIQVSDDANTWTSIYSTTTGSGGREALNVAGAGRYLRIYLRARATAYGYSLWELDVRAGAAAAGMPGDGTGGGGARDSTLLSYHKPVEASSSRDDSGCRHCDPAKVVDSDPATRWATGDPSSTPGWIAVDLGAPANIHQVALQWAGEYARTYEIQVSPDARTWTTVYHSTAGKGLLETLPVQGSGRYVRVHATEGASPNGYSLWEFKVYGTGGAPLPPPTAPPAPKDPLRLVWSDEFNGPVHSAPNPRKWHPDLGPGFTGELQYYTDNKNAYQDGTGNLVLEARREVTPGTTCPTDPVSRSTTCQYTSARLNTYGSYSFTYGRVEARIKVSATQALWPAFWLLGENLYTGQALWPACGEIDVMEHIGGMPNEISSTLHAPAYFSQHGIGAPYRAGSDFAAGFHVYAVDWRPDRITFSVDGNAFFTVDRNTTETTRGPWVFDHPFVLVLDNAIGGPFPGQPDGRTVLPQQMLVDYVRVYQ